ncbi:DUF6056 family protein [Paenibacillus terrigena]|uniref:DUF3329 domain-containing protein n=1 Tax=Paenibacillus terrigena TaxID=369333 RepID=UPI0028D69800|nr:DUF6056 family protein [Paenibacillus terrigena]
MKNKINVYKLATLLAISIIYIYIFIINTLVPLWNDEHAYSFIFSTSERIENIRDILRSEYILYHEWTGRVIVHTIVQFFLLLGKSYFNVVNAFMFIMLMILMTLFTKLRKFDKLEDFLAIIFCAVLSWFLLPVIGETVFWVAGSVNYMWTTVVALIFLLPFRYLLEDKLLLNDSKKNTFIMLIVGLFAGWSQENVAVISVFFVIMNLIYLKYKKLHIPKWCYSGGLGVIIGCMILVLAPGNTARKQGMYFEVSLWEQVITTIVTIKNLILYNQRYIFVLLIILILTNLVSKKLRTEYKTQLILSLLFISAGFISYFAMVASPEFPIRASFPGAVFFIITINILVPKNRNWIGLGLIAMAIPLLTSTQHVLNQYDELHQESTARIELVKDNINSGNLDVRIPKLTVNPDKYVFIFDVTTNPEYTSNQHFAQYYNLKSVAIDSPYLIIDLVDPVINSYQLFYDTGKGYNEEESTSVYVGNRLDGKELFFELPDRNIMHYRFDPGYKKDQLVKIKSMTLYNGSTTVEISGEKLINRFKPTNEINSVFMKDGILNIETLGNDPQLEIFLK